MDTDKISLARDELNLSAICSPVTPCSNFLTELSGNVILIFAMRYILKKYAKIKKFGMPEIWND